MNTLKTLNLRSSLISAMLLMIAFSTLLVAPSSVWAAQQVSYEDYKPFLKELRKGVESTESASATVKTHSESLNIDTDDPASLVDFIAERAEATQDGKGLIVDRKIQMIGDKALSVCLGTEHKGGTIGSTTFCQGLENNLLTKLTVKDSDGNVIGDYRTNG